MCENKFSDFIEDNHTLYGLHLQGNQCYVDSFGFVKTDKWDEYNEYSKPVVISKSSSDGYSIVNKVSLDRLETIVRSTRCWTWEGWREIAFNIGLELVEDTDGPIWIHFDYNSYQGNFVILG